MPKEAPRAVVQTGAGSREFAFCSREFYPFEFVRIEIEDRRWVLARVRSVRASNRNFDAEKLGFYLERPIDRRLLEDTVFEYGAQTIGVMDGDSGEVEGVFVPPSPGQEVLLFDDARLLKALGLGDEETGVKIGCLKGLRHLSVCVDRRFFDGHCAILGQTGSGKSHLASILLEAIIGLRERWGTDVLPIVLDLSGEYAEPEGKYRGVLFNFNVIDGSMLRLPLFSRHYFYSFCDLLGLNARETSELVAIRRSSSGDFPGSTSELAERLAVRGGIGLTAAEKVGRHAIRISEEEKLSVSFPRSQDGLVVALHEVGLLEDQQFVVRFVVDYVLERWRKEFRRTGRRVVIFVEEAHNLVPSVHRSMAKDAIVRVAREGRKFGVSLCLISQRPRWVDPTVLSQCRSIFLLRTQNSDDVNHIFEHVAFVEESLRERLSSLGVGDTVLAGFPTRLPTLLEVKDVEEQFHWVRQRKVAKERIKEVKEVIDKGGEEVRGPSLEPGQ